MLIVNDRRTLIVPSENIAEMNIHSSGIKIMVKLMHGGQMDIPVAVYSNCEKASIAFSRCVRAWERDDVIFRFPDDNDAELDTSIRSTGSKHYSKTTGKEH